MEFFVGCLDLFSGTIIAMLGHDFLQLPFVAALFLCGVAVFGKLRRTV